MELLMLPDAELRALPDDEVRELYLGEVRARYTQSEIDELGKKGQAFGPDDEGHYSYPIADVEDLKKAIKAVGRGNAEHEKIRKFIMKRADELGEKDAIPDTWNSDGTLKSDQKSLPRSVEWRRAKAREVRGMERRVRLEHVEIREADDGQLHLSGYASVTEAPYDMGWYTETVKRGAFKKTLAEDPDVQLLVNHAGLPLARTKSGTLQLSEDNTGLRVEADLDPEDPDVQSLARKMKRGDIDQMSFAFRATRQEWDEDYSQRFIVETDLHRGDVSVVNQGANPATSTSIRTDDALIALRHMGPLGYLETLLDLRRYAGTPRTKRAGKSLSAATMDVLTNVLKLIATADEAVDEAQPLLAELMGVDNPDEDADDTACGSCGAMNDSDAAYCDQCGGAIPSGNDAAGSDSTGGSDDSASRSAALIDEARRVLESFRYPKRGNVA